MDLIIQENQRGLLFRDGRFAGVLRPGKYRAFRKDKDEKKNIYRGLFGKIVEVLNCTGPVTSTMADTRVLLENEDLRREVAELTVARGELGFRFVDGSFGGGYFPGKHAFWNIHGENSFFIADTTDPFVADDFPREIFRTLKHELYAEISVDARSHGILFIDGKFEKLLPPGRHYFWKGDREIDVRLIPSCLTKEELTGQEILTADKVTLRINCVCEYTVTDPVRAATEVGDLSESLHLAAQLALREYVGSMKLDDILADRENISKFLLGRLQEKAAELFIEIRSASVKDIILPGEIREIMNTVLLAEKRAQASVITRREEVASTRSLLNTAKLMEENATLYKLKELEYIERICQHLDSLSLGGGGDIVAQLTAAFAGSKK